MVIIYRDENDLASFVVCLARFQGADSFEVVLAEVADAVFGRAASIPYLFRNIPLGNDGWSHNVDLFLFFSLRRVRGLPSAVFRDQCFSLF
jgi:hypothetical protein